MYFDARPEVTKPLVLTIGDVPGDAAGQAAAAAAAVASAAAVLHHRLLPVQALQHYPGTVVVRAVPTTQQCHRGTELQKNDKDRREGKGPCYCLVGIIDSTSCRAS